MKWLLRSDTAAELRHALKSPAAFDVERRERFMADASARRSSALSVSGDIAQINVVGLLTKTPDFVAMLFGFGNTTYGEISDALASADADPRVSRLVMNVDSPGGTVAGLFEALQALSAFTKPVSVVASCACSAAYAIAAVAGKITAVTPASEFGSVGVACSILVDDQVVDLASTNAPNKRPDVRTPEGQGAVRAELDAIHDLFVKAIADGRKTDTATVNQTFGRGGVMLASAARRAGMIDRVASPAGKKTASADPYVDLGAYVAQRAGGPMPGEDELGFAERIGELMAKCRTMRARGASVSEFIALFDRDDEDDETAAGLPPPPRGMRGSPYEPGDIGDQVAARFEALRGGRPLSGEREAAAYHGPKDLGDRVADLMEARRLNPSAMPTP